MKVNNLYSFSNSFFSNSTKPISTEVQTRHLYEEVAACMSITDESLEYVVQRIQKLIDRGADLNYIGDQGTCLHILTEKCFVQYEECDPKLLKIMELLLKAGADPNIMAEKKWSQTCRAPQTPLYLAICSGVHDSDTRALKLLIRYGGDPTRATEDCAYLLPDYFAFYGSGYSKVKKIVNTYIKDHPHSCNHVIMR